MKRDLQQFIEKDLSKKIVFIVGPRQVGKTYLSKKIAQNYQKPLYLNFDNAKDREVIREQSWLQSTDLIIFDEIHKMPNWKNYIKGVFDTRAEQLHILVTGSARMEVFQQSGDSLAGRFFLYHLMPFTPAELKETKFQEIDDYIQRGGFPEPFLSEDEIDAKRWRRQYVNGLVREDILNFENIKDLKTINLLFELLRERVGSCISYSSLARDLNCAPNSIKKYIDILEALFIVFTIPPFSKNIARSILKESKLYFFDTGLVKGDEGIKFENLVALSLLSFTHQKNDTLGESYRLHYLRTKDKREVDFAIANEDTLQEIIEVKNRKGNMPPFLSYFVERYNVNGTLLVKHLRLESCSGNIQIRNGKNYLQEL